MAGWVDRFDRPVGRPDGLYRDLPDPDVVRNDPLWDFNPTLGMPEDMSPTELYRNIFPKYLPGKTPVTAPKTVAPPAAAEPVPRPPVGTPDAPITPPEPVPPAAGPPAGPTAPAAAHVPTGKPAPTAWDELRAGGPAGAPIKLGPQLSPENVRSGLNPDIASWENKGPANTFFKGVTEKIKAKQPVPPDEIKAGVAAALYAKLGNDPAKLGQVVAKAYGDGRWNLQDIRRLAEHYSLNELGVDPAMLDQAISDEGLMSQFSDWANNASPWELAAVAIGIPLTLAGAYNAITGDNPLGSIMTLMGGAGAMWAGGTPVNQMLGLPSPADAWNKVQGYANMMGIANKAQGAWDLAGKKWGDIKESIGWGAPKPATPPPTATAANTPILEGPKAMERIFA
jgi:hypothetical protein